MFISFEGIEASGKSTLLAAVDRALRREHTRTLITREPGGTAAGEAIREVFLHRTYALEPMAEVMLVNAARAQLVREVIRPQLQAGTAVLCDRYVHSTLAYQGYGRGLDLQSVRAVCDAATEGLMPDLTFLLDISPETSRRRLAERGNGVDRLEAESDAFHMRVRQGFLALGKHDPRVMILDGEASPEDVFDSAMAALSALL